MEIILDENRQVTKVVKDGTTFLLKGECLKCGQCCDGLANCPSAATYTGNADADKPFLEEQTLDGETVYLCKVQWNKPYPCKIYPSDPDEPLDERCGYYWEEEA